MVGINQLRELQPAAWTALLSQNPDTQGSVVKAVEQEQLANARRVTRYWLTLAGYREQVTLLGKQTSEIEARFYQDLAPQIPFLTPHCWFSHVSGDASWIVIDEVYDDRPTKSWLPGDVEAILENIAALHASFWQRDDLLRDQEWPSLIDSPGRRTPSGADWDEVGASPALQPGDRAARKGDWQGEKPSLPSEHALSSAGSLAPTLLEAAEGLEILMSLGGWPGVIEDRHLLAVADLLDDPVPAIHPLRELPSTLLHGDLSTDKWHLNLFGGCQLLDWKHIMVGPGVYDLVGFIDRFDLLARRGGGLRGRENWPMSEETMEDSYILALGARLGSGFDATATRQAIPAARCLYVLATWLPRLSTWFKHTPGGRARWNEFRNLSDERLAAGGFEQMAKMRTYLAGVFSRFLKAYYAL